MLLLWPETGKGDKIFIDIGLDNQPVHVNCLFHSENVTVFMCVKEKSGMILIGLECVN